MKKYLNGLSIILLTLLFLAACSTKTEVVQNGQVRETPIVDSQKESSVEKTNPAQESVSVKTQTVATLKPSEEVKTKTTVATTATIAISDKPTLQQSTSSEVKEISITAQQWQFTPSTITVKKGDKVKITLTSKDVTHGFNLPAYGINEQIQKDKNTVVEFTADKAGTFPFACAVFCGSGHGKMSGTLVVEP